MEDTTKVLKACIVASKGGVPQDQLDNEFFKLTGNYIPYLKLGFTSLYEYLGTVKDLIKKRNAQNQLVYTVMDPKIAHISEMVENQKDSNHRVYGTRTFARSINKPARICAKRKATKDQGTKRAQKRRKEDVSNKMRYWTQCNRDSSSDDADNWVRSGNYQWLLDEYNHPVQINEEPQQLDVVCQPIVNGKQLIGDDFFLQLAIRNIGTPIWRNGPCTALHTGLCKSGQTIKECTNTVKKVEALANKLVIMLGAEDIYRGRSAEKMIEDMEDLLDFLEVHHAYSRSAITLCTIPPMANLSMNCNSAQVRALNIFNNWIRTQTHVSFTDSWNSGLRYNLIDFHNKNTHVRGSTNYEFFQLDARMVSGSSHPYVLWSVRGRRLAMNLLRAGQ